MSSPRLAWDNSTAGAARVEIDRVRLEAGVPLALSRSPSSWVLQPLLGQGRRGREAPPPAGEAPCARPGPSTRGDAAEGECRGPASTSIGRRRRGPLPRHVAHVGFPTTRAGDGRCPPRAPPASVNPTAARWPRSRSVPTAAVAGDQSHHAGRPVGSSRFSARRAPPTAAESPERTVRRAPPCATWTGWPASWVARRHPRRRESGRTGWPRCRRRVAAVAYDARTRERFAGGEDTR